MNSQRRSECTVLTIILGLSLGLSTVGCKQEPQGVPRPPANTKTVADKPAMSGQPSDPAGGMANPHSGTADPHGGTASPQGQNAAMTGNTGPASLPDIDISGVSMSDKTITLEGVSFTIPDGWIREEPKVNPRMPSATPKAQFRLPKADNEVEDVGVIITHFPGMRGMDDANLRRWYGQFSQPDGRPTEQVARRADYTMDGVSVTLVDIPGTMAGGGPMVAGPTEDHWRMLAAIINHGSGPHFFKLSGPSDGVERWKASAVAFLKSAKATR